MSGVLGVGQGSSVVPVPQAVKPLNDSTLRKVLTCVPIVTFFMQISNGMWHNKQVEEHPYNEGYVFEASIFHENCTHATNLLSILALAVIAAVGAANPFVIIGALVLITGSVCLSLYRLDYYKDEYSKCIE